jgi:hypothetical protein
LISAEPIDYSQIEFYILLANKSQANIQPMPAEYRLPPNDEAYKYNQGLQPQNHKGLSDSDKKNTNSKNLNSPKKYLIPFYSEKIWLPAWNRFNHCYSKIRKS